MSQDLPVPLPEPRYYIDGCIVMQQETIEQWARACMAPLQEDRAEFLQWKAERDEQARKRGAYWLTPEGIAELHKCFDGDDTAVPVLLAEVERLRLELSRLKAQEPWRDHVEQRLLTWRQRFVNKSGDQLALDDFMGQESIDDLVDFVCDEYAAPPSQEQT